MKPVRIYLKNFMNHCESEIDCTKFSKILIIGKHKNSDRISNGVGKTTIFNAIEWAVYNESHSTLLDKIVREGAKKAVVEYDFSLKKQLYRVYRHRTARGAADLRLYQWDGLRWEPISERTPAETHLKLRELIKISHKAFTYSTLFRQADLTGLSSAKDPKARKEILKEPLDLSRYSKLERLAGDKARPIKRDISKLKGSIEILGDPTIAKKAAEVSLEEVIKEIKNKQFKLDNEISLILDNKRQYLDELKSSLDSSGSDLHKNVDQQRMTVKELNRESDRCSDQLSLNKTKASRIDSEIISLNSQLNSSSRSLARELKEKHRVLSIIKKEISDLIEKENKGIELITQAKFEIKSAKESLPEKDTCNICYQPITLEYRMEFTKKLNKKIEITKTDLEFYEDILIKCKKQRTQVEKELSKAEDNLKRSNDLQHMVNSFKEKIVFSEEAKTTCNKFNDKLINDLSLVSHKLQEAIKLYDLYKKAASESDNTDLNSKIISVQEEISIYEKAEKTIYGEVSFLKTKEGSLIERVNSSSNDIKKLKELNSTLVTLNLELKIRKMVIDSYSHRGIPSSIIYNLLDELNLEVNKSLHELRPELTVQLDSDLNIEYRRHGKIREYGMLSHGQHVYIALAFKRALSKIIQKKIGIDLGMLAFDEVDSNLDESGIDAFADCIKQWQKDFTIFVITHNKDLKDTFSHAILVEEGDDGSNAKLVSEW